MGGREGDFTPRKHPPFFNYGGALGHFRPKIYPRKLVGSPKNFFMTDPSPPPMQGVGPDPSGDLIMVPVGP